MKKLIDRLIKSNIYAQIFFCAFYRFLNILVRVESIFLLIIIFYFSQITAVFFKSEYILALKAAFLWIIASHAKPSLAHPGLGVAGFRLFCSLILLLYSISMSFRVGLFLALCMLVSSLFLMNDPHDSFKKNFLKTLVFIRSEWIFVFVVFVPFLLSLAFLYHFSPFLVLFFLGYFLVFIQLIIVKSLCMCNNFYYHQGS